ncbi:S-adenosyl-L-methionine-dependent methyltransferase [Massariosphaeria phaeospora]|uniref:S-adenosyl-L-methionine-dependent methyltransferase n=1 Tax=Massariosphaeria phaeospora TaxID=100035 RepID=A0A7C8MIR4_9PLEO|nr:S-adenosyl-L-methionine-dependent methyltransferase [Massariosphaeria phaeospora]
MARGSLGSECGAGSGCVHHKPRAGRRFFRDPSPSHRCWAPPYERPWPGFRRRVFGLPSPPLVARLPQVSSGGQRDPDLSSDMASPPAAAATAATAATDSPPPAPPAPAAAATGASPPAADQAPASPDFNVPQVGIEAESAEIDDGDSAYGDDLQSYTTSLKSTVLNYRHENGRRYHGFKDEEAKYFFPNDDMENDRLDLFHHILTLSLDGELHLAPIGDNPQRILDLGTGTGIWAIDMGDKYPSADVLGNDISPIQPSLVPPNVRFEVDDLEDEWVYSSKFDFVHCRYLACSIRDWPKLMAQAFKYTKPGGWVEFQDMDTRFYTASGGIYTQDNVIGEWADTIANELRKFGVEPDPGWQLLDWVKAAGFTNVSNKTLPLPIGTWPKDRKLKEVGAFNLIQYLDNVEGMTLRLYTSSLGWSPDEIKVLCAKLREALKNPRMRIQHNFYVVWAQKPWDAVD